MNVSFTIDDIRLKSASNIDQTLVFTHKSFIYTVLGFTQSHSVPLHNIESFNQIISGSYKSDKLFNFIGIVRVLLKDDCINGSKVNGIREPILYGFALDKLPCQKLYNEPQIKFF